jgi:hypothetical protein
MVDKMFESLISKKEVPIEKKELNLVPEIYLIEKSKQRTKTARIATITVIITIIVVFVATPFGINIILGYQTEDAKKLAASTNKYMEIETQLNKVREMLQTRKTQAEQLTNAYPDIKTALEHIEWATPDNVSLSSVNVKDSVANTLLFSITGIALKDTDTAAFVNSLAKDRVFDLIFLSDLNSGNSGSSGTASASIKDGSGLKYTFNLSLRYTQPAG